MVMILGVLALFILVLLNPITQIQKSQDAKREHDLKQLQTALDTYYNDKNFYPSGTLSELTSSKTIQTLPNDPTASSGWPNYAYTYDSNGTPQWNVLFARMALPSSTSFTCPLAQLKNSSGSSCLPSNYVALGYNYCVVSGSIDSVACDQISASTLTPLPISGQSSGGGAATPTPGNAPTPTPHPFYCYCSSATYWIDPSKDPSHQCQVVQASSDPTVNFDRFCANPCVNPCTP